MVGNVAERLYNALMMDSEAMLSAACYDDFGLGRTEQEFYDRFGALQDAVRSGATLEELSNALGSSKKLTALVKQYGSTVIFPPTIWDELKEESTGEEIFNTAMKESFEKRMGFNNFPKD